MGAFETNSPTVHHSNRMDRALDLMEEGVFLQLWIEYQERVVGFNDGYGALDLILNEKSYFSPPGMSKAQRLDLINRWSQRDALVAASVIQWLGTKEGKIFIDKAENRIDEIKKQFQIDYHQYWNLGVGKKVGVSPESPLKLREDDHATQTDSYIHTSDL